VSYAYECLFKKEHQQFKSPRAKVLLKGIRSLLRWLSASLRGISKIELRLQKDTKKLLISLPPMPHSVIYRFRVPTSSIGHAANFAQLSQNDITNASVSAATGSSAGNIRTEEIAVQNTRVEGGGSVNIQDSISMATDACGKRSLDLRRCSLCTTVNVRFVARHVSRIKDVQRSVADYSHSPYLGCCVCRGVLSN